MPVMGKRSNARDNGKLPLMHAASQNAANPIYVLKHKHGIYGYHFVDICRRHCLASKFYGLWAYRVDCKSSL